jgi:hypothetical protein
MLIRHIARSASKGLSSRRASKALVGPAGLRPATTLTEVLVAIFVMAIGLMALLTLFPLGALSMWQAIKDDRTAHGGRNAASIAAMFNIHNDPYLYPAGTVTVGAVGPYNYTDAFVNPYPFQQVGTVGPGMPPQTDPTKPSYPVYVDPYAFYFLSSQAIIPNLTVPSAIPFSPMVGQTVGNVGTVPQATAPGIVPGTGIPRRSPSFVPTSQAAIRWFTLLDDINNFQDTALPALAPSAPAFLFPPPINTTGQNVIPTIQRENRYSSAYMLRRPKSGDPTVVDMSIVIYSGRSLSVLGESAFTLGVDPATFAVTPTGVRFDPSLNYVDVAFPAGQAPSIRRGSWILDATVVVPPPNFQPDPHGFFYRVVEVTDLTVGTPGFAAIRLELQTTPKAASYYIPAPGSPAVPYGVLIVMDNVAEVFDKGQGWKP